MIRQFSKNNKPFAQTSDELYAKKYLSDGCEEVPVLYTGGFIDPMWNGASWYEGAPVSELNAQKKQEILNYLSDMISKINRYITAIAMGKSVHDDLDYYELAYTTKYNLCKAYKLNPNADPYNTLATEAQLEGVAKVNEYVDFVISKFENGKTFRDRGVQLIECLRKRIYADLATNNFEVANQRLKIIDDLPADVKAEQVGAIYNQVMTL